MIAAVIGVGGALFLAIVTGAWHLGGRMARVEAQLKHLVNGSQCAERRESLHEAIRHDLESHARIFHT